MKFIKHFLISLLLFSTAAMAKENITKIVIYSAAGGQVHANALRLQNELNRQLNGTFVIDIKAGAEGLIAAEYVNTYKNSNNLVLLMGTAIRWENVPNRRNLNLLDDFHLISYYGTFPAYVITGKHKNVNTFTEFLEKSKTTKISYGISLNHTKRSMIKQLFTKYGNINNVQEITYRSGSQSVVDVVNGNLDFIVVSPDNVRSLVKEDKLKFVSTLDLKFNIDNIPTLKEENIIFDNAENFSASLFVWSNNNYNSEQIEKIRKIIENIVMSGNTSGLIVNLDYLKNSSQILRSIINEK